MTKVLMKIKPQTDPLAEAIFFCTECEDDVRNSEVNDHVAEVHQAEGAEMNSLGFMRPIPYPERVDLIIAVPDIRPAEGDEVIPEPEVEVPQPSLQVPTIEEAEALDANNRAEAASGQSS